MTKCSSLAEILL